VATDPMELEPESQMSQTLVVELPSNRDNEDWFEAALLSDMPRPSPVRNSWGDEEEEEPEEEGVEGDAESDDDDNDPFEDFDEDDFDDDFDDDFEEELEDEYEIEPADDGMLEGHPDAEDIDDDAEADPDFAEEA
jgi:hypothetical protein